MDVCDQMTALAERGLEAGDSALYWRAPRYGGLECLAARFVTHKYAPHTHDTYVVGAIVAGCETFVVRGERCFAVPGEVCFVHPGEVHDGEPHGDGYAYRMSYPTVALMRDIAAELTGREDTGTPWFPETVVHDPEGAARFVAAHMALAHTDALYGDERFVSTMALLLSRHARLGDPAPIGRERGPVRRAQEYLDAHYADNVDLPTLAGVAGVSRFHLIRAFRKETGLTPHAWLADRRVRAARGLLASGRTPGEAAADCGFADQSHLTRAFKARVGVTPGRFRSASLDAA
jgi:AraC-like DNA-binding protein